MMDINAAIIVKLADLPVSPHFDSPFLSASLAEFWSKRWNLTIGNTLRTLVYDPISEGEISFSHCKRSNWFQLKLTVSLQIKI